MEEIKNKLKRFDCVHQDIEDLGNGVIQTITTRTISYQDILEIGNMKATGLIRDFNLLGYDGGVIITLRVNDEIEKKNYSLKEIRTHVLNAILDFKKALVNKKDFDLEKWFKQNNL